VIDVTGLLFSIFYIMTALATYGLLPAPRVSAAPGTR